MPSKAADSLAERLLDKGLISERQLAAAQAESDRTAASLPRVMTRMGIVTESEMASHLSEITGAPHVTLSTYDLKPDVLELVSEELARSHEVVPLLRIGDRLVLAMADPQDVPAIDAVSRQTGLSINAAVATESEIRRALAEHYGSAEVNAIIDTIEYDPRQAQDEEAAAQAVEDDAPVVRLVNALISQALAERASDIHVEPDPKKVCVRMRVDGVLHEVSSPPRFAHASIISRLKIMAGMDIAERRVPQDGRMMAKLDNREIDIRVSTIPTVHGEKAVLRLLDPTNAQTDLGSLGMDEGVLSSFRSEVHQPHGIVLVTGPTGSGKSTTLYAALREIRSPEKNITTIEEPVEYRLSGVQQIQVNTKAGLTFASGLRSILRQDPDVIMVGEIRDLETAEIAVRAALTGHLVLSTLHTNDAPSAATRLIDMGVPQFLVASPILGVLGQRLLRAVCPHCAKPVGLPAEIREEMGELADGEFVRGRGCPACKNTGYKGRIGAFEWMVPNEDIRQMIMQKAPSSDLRSAAVRAGMKTMRRDALRKAASGITTVDEVLRTTARDRC